MNVCELEENIGGNEFRQNNRHILVRFVVSLLLLFTTNLSGMCLLLLLFTTNLSGMWQSQDQVCGV